MSNVIEKLNDPSVEIRLNALKDLAAQGDFPVPGENVNMHMHSFFSYNAHTWSPARVAYEARKGGLVAAGLIDFDVLDGLVEFYRAGEILGLRTDVGLETRVYYREFADDELDSPGEPGVHYIDGIGFTHVPKAGTPEAAQLQAYRQGAQDRNQALVDRINAAVSDLQLDYQAEVIPLSPGGCPTERHIISAFVSKSLNQFEGEALTRFWSELLECDEAKAKALLEDRPSLEDKARSRLAKKGGLAYVQPDESSFPPIDDFFAWVKACGAIPMESWLDGTSSGEAKAEELIDCTYAKGARALNIIPDRNWNLKNPDEKKTKIECLRRIVRLATERHMPINIGTELNKLGLPFVDDLDGPVLSEFKEVFRRGAFIAVGHAVCGRFADLGYLSDAAEAEFPDFRKRNDFFEAVGRLPAVTVDQADAWRQAGAEKVLNEIRESVIRSQ